MWCPDDVRRDSWDWVGPPAWGRACFNSPEWRGGSSPVKTEPPQIVLLLLFRTRVQQCVCPLRPIGGRSPGSGDSSPLPSPSTTKNSSSSRGQKIHSRNVQTAENVCQIQEAHGKMSGFPRKKLLGGRCRPAGGAADRRREHSTRCTRTSKTNKIHATAVVDDERGTRRSRTCNDLKIRVSPFTLKITKFFQKPPWS